MAGKEISQLLAAAPLSGQEVLPGDQQGKTVAITAQNIANLAAGAGGGVTLPILESNVTNLVADLATLTSNVATNTTNITTNTTNIALKAPLASPTFTGTVTIPTGASIIAPTGLVKGDVGLGNVDNTADASKAFAGSQITSGTVAIARIPTGTTSTTVPLGGVITGGSAGSASQSLSVTYNAAGQLTAVTANSIAIAASQVTSGLSGTYAPLASPTFTGTVVLPAATVTLAMQVNAAANSIRGNNTGSAAVPADLTVAQTKALLAIAESDVTNLTSDLALKAPLASPTFTGTVTIPGGASISGFAPLASPTFTGTATMPLVRFTGGAYTALLTDVSTTVTNTFATTANMYHRGIDLSPTDTWSVASLISSMFLGVNSAGTFVNAAGSAIDLGPVVSFQANYVKAIDTQTGRSMGAFDTDFNSAPIYQSSNSGTFTSAAHTSFAASGTLNAASSTMTSHKGLSSAFTVTSGTLTTLTHIILVDPTGAGTVTTQIGIDIPALSKAGTNIGIRNKANTQLGSSAQLTVDTSGNLSTSGSLTTSGSGTLTIAGNIGFNGKAAQATTGWSAPTATLVRAALANPTYTTTGGTGVTAGAFDTAAHRDNVITDLFTVTKTLAALITDLRANGVIA